jgi:hypothetical protein
MTFVVEDVRPSDSPYVEMIWRTQSGSAGSFISQAISRWELVIMNHRGKTMVAVRGPETKASPASFPAEADWLGVTFKLGTFMPHLPLTRLLDGCGIELPEAAHKSFWLHGSSWELPTYENADMFVMRLKHEGLLEHDPIVDAVLQGEPQAFSPRALQYRFLRATGLTQNKVHQIERAKRAAALLANGLPILETAYEVGYFDQSHLTNALKRFLGQTPAQIARVSQPE